MLNLRTAGTDFPAMPGRFRDNRVFGNLCDGLHVAGLSGAKVAAVMGVTGRAFSPISQGRLWHQNWPQNEPGEATGLPAEVALRNPDTVMRLSRMGLAMPSVAPVARNRPIALRSSRMACLTRCGLIG